MTYSLTNKSAKNYYNRTFIVQVIARNVATCFFETQCKLWHKPGKRLLRQFNLLFTSCEAVISCDDRTGN